MKKPEIKGYDYEPFAVIKAGGEWLNTTETYEAYDEMIDALIECNRVLDICRDKINTSEYNDFVREVDESIESNYKALKKAGCTE